jgi:hypothetical protein
MDASLEKQSGVTLRQQGVLMSRRSTFVKVAEDHVRSLLASGQSEDDAARELGTLASSLDAEGQTEFARALRAVSRRHGALAPQTPLTPATAANQQKKAS